ncbi:hypothetical protein C2G38_2173869 [Gigaspora rosea]|uniref:TLDc domain-containing protein n=1 Tax=Gigaspora rosea TaxID=44941 RepID=A0A397VKF7_9GLOM|nr:hypothetical protein C2G38_2173869 [Gigaspora rosea]
MGIAQNQGLPSDPEDRTPENFQALKTTLQNCLPLIRYFQISGNDIPTNSRKKSLERYNEKDRRSNSTNIVNNLSTSLLLRGSRDGFTLDTFWNLCNKKENVVLIIKVKGTDQILDGYNSIGWERPYSFK